MIPFIIWASSPYISFVWKFFVHFIFLYILFLYTHTIKNVKQKIQYRYKFISYLSEQLSAADLWLSQSIQHRRTVERCSISVTFIYFHFCIVSQTFVVYMNVHVCIMYVSCIDTYRYIHEAIFQYMKTTWNFMYHVLKILKIIYYNLYTYMLIKF